MSLYHDLIREATGAVDDKLLDEIEACMRSSVFHHPLDGATAQELKMAAKIAHDVIKLSKVVYAT